MARERLNREDRRNAILDAAAAVFGEKGFGATRMDDVAAAAGIAKGLLYKHFSSKDELFEALIDRQGRQYVAELRGALLAAQPVGEPMEILSRGLTLWLGQAAGDPATFQWNDPGLHNAYDDLRDRMRDVIADAIQTAAPDTERAVAWLVAAAIQGAAENFGLAWAREYHEQVPRELALMLLSGFCWGGLALLQDTAGQPAT